ncbi:biopolymer transporter ExbD [Paracoccus sp. M683]|uniref:biopolymer transporter ExbD n=1 Tax=Paracoccus sp. M683 TaxID=2594268 RepID=UPI00117FF3E5|nr:biopolymer transporter ExbD [Paracoccus sp. M683]TRW96008.1 biopolymer transporter ExbD [Paracoccus sp. M683]
MSSFRLTPPPRRARGEPIIPMINVVFLLLIFFLLSASIAPQELLQVAPPEGSAETPETITAPLLVSADGQLAYAGTEGEAVWPLLALRDTAEDLPVRADAALPAAQLAAIMSRLAATTTAPVALVVQPREDDQP